GDLAAAAEYWKRVPDHPPREGGTARFLEGKLFLEAHRARDAEAAFLKSIEVHPDYLQPHEWLLKLYGAQLREEETTRELHAIGRFRPLTFTELYESIGRRPVQGERQLVSRLEKYIAADPDDLHSLMALARFHIWDDQHRTAEALLRGALSRHPRAPQLHAYLAESLLGQLDLAGARRALAEAPLGPAAPQCVWKSHGLYWTAAGDWRRAAICLGRAAKLGPADRGTAFKLGQALEHAGYMAGAQHELQRAQWLLQLHAVMFRLTESPGVPLPLTAEAADLFLKLAYPAVAAAFFERIAGEYPESAAARENYARAVQQTPNKTPPPASVQDVAREVASDLDKLRAGPPAGDEQIPSLRPPGLPTHPAIRFVDRHQETGIDFQYFSGDTGQRYLLETTGGGVGVLDYDGDGWPDLYFPQGCRIPFQPDDSTYTDRLYRNLGNDSFLDVTNATGLHENQYSQGCAAGDYDNDGFTDLAVANFGTNAVYRNNGDGTFSDVSPVCGISDLHYSTSLGWSDLDGDGNLDLVVVNYVLDPLRICYRKNGAPAPCYPLTYQAQSPILYGNLGDGAFADVTQAAGLVGNDGRGLGLVIADFDDDGRPDVYVANDGTACFLFHNLRPPPGQRFAFAEMGLPSGTAVNGEGRATAAMGVACGDLDGDGRLDLYVTNFFRESDILYLNRGELIFEDATKRGGLSEATRSMLGWGAQAIDVDLDGRLDLFQTNGHIDDYRDLGTPWKMPSQLFYNGGAGAFTDISRGSGDFFGCEHLGRGVARLDWNRDGRHDLVIAYQDRPAALLTNESPETGHRVVVQLHGVQSNRDAIGARLRASYSGQKQTLEIAGGDGYCASNEKRQIIGIGRSTKLDLLEIRWPSGREDHWQDVPADSELIVIEGRPPLAKKIQGD
ncbi:MAG TPA: FG-GAP-like repeat-containing protein, partial [Planctomycetaceae bacterium]